MNPVKGQAMLFVGDFSYADHYEFLDNSRWDSCGRLLNLALLINLGFGLPEIMSLILSQVL